MALVAWLVVASRDTTSQIFFIFGQVFLIPAAGLVHGVAGSTEVLIRIFMGETS